MFLLSVCYIIALVCSLIGITYHINLWKYPIYYSAPLILAVYLPASVTILLPLDYVSHNAGAIEGFHLSDDTILLMWKGTYWSTFLLTWLVLPILQEYYRAGNYSKLGKLKTSLKNNAKFQAITLSCSLACAIYLILEVGLTFKNLRSMIIALSHIYSIVLALWLMAHGMIVIPKHRWIDGGLVQSLNHMYIQIPNLVDHLEDTKNDLKEEVIQIMILSENFTDATTSGDFKFRDWILDLDSQIPRDFKDSSRRHFVNSSTRAIQREQVTEEFMSALTNRFQIRLYNMLAYSSEYDVALRRIVSLRKIIDAKCSQTWSEREEILGIVGSSLKLKISFYAQCYFTPIMARLQSITIYILSFIVIESEFFHSTNLSLINVLAYKMGIFTHHLVQAIFLMSIFMFMLFCTVYSLSRLRIFNMYHLVPRYSDPMSACFYGSYIARMTIPLSYNFIALFTSRKSIFEEWYGQSIHLSGLFNLMNNWIPRLLLIPIVLAIFNLYEKIKASLGLSSNIDEWAGFDDMEQLNNSNCQDALQVSERELAIVEAKRLVNVELDRRKRQNFESDRHSRNILYVPPQLRLGTSPSASNENVLSPTPKSHGQDEGRISALWGRLESSISGIKNHINFSFDRSRSQSQPSSVLHSRYRDEDDDLEDHLIV